LILSVESMTIPIVSTVLTEVSAITCERRPNQLVLYKKINKKIRWIRRFFILMLMLKLATKVLYKTQKNRPDIVGTVINQKPTVEQKFNQSISGYSHSFF
jgi:hypothetical protein